MLWSRYQTAVGWFAGRVEHNCHRKDPRCRVEQSTRPCVAGLAALPGWGLVPDRVSATQHLRCLCAGHTAPCSRDHRCVCHSNHGGLWGPREGECKLGTAPPAWHLCILPLAHRCTLPTCCKQQDRRDPGRPLLCSPLTAPLALLLPPGSCRAPVGLMATVGTQVQVMWLQRDRPRLHVVLGGSSEEVPSLSQTCLSGSRHPQFYSPGRIA